MAITTWICVLWEGEKARENIQDISEAFILSNWVPGGTNDWVEKGEG